MIQTFHVFKTYGARTALEDINITLKKGEFICINGPSGAGKTTLLKLFYAGERPTKGQILVDGVNLQRLKGKNLALFRRKIGVVFQDFKLLDDRTVFENVALPLEVSGYNNAAIRKKVSNVLRSVGLEHRMFSRPPFLSGGEQQRVAFARAIVNDPLVLLADEPTGNLDVEAAEAVLGLLKEYNSGGKIVVLATHDHDLVARYGSRALYLKDGRTTDA
ncbi:MAG: cell division ATP-binding protein FtsE [Pseudomonadota bacterium]